MLPVILDALLSCSLANITMLFLFLCVKMLLSNVVNGQASLIQCLESHSLPTIVESSPNYLSATQDFNLRVKWKPLVLVTPSTAEEVSSAVQCANTHNVKVAARGGGHSYAGNGMGGADGSLVIDMKKFKTLRVDPDTHEAIIGAGNRLGNVATALYEHGERGLPHGTCPGVGFAGHALHGGYGHASRMWGTTLDNIISVEVVLADGRIVNASETEHPDLFWAIRGTGSSFGIVTNFHLKTHPAPANGVSFSIIFPEVNDTSTWKKVDLFLAIQDFAVTRAPPELSMRVWTYTDVFGLFGAYWGTQSDFFRAIDPLLMKLPQDSKLSFDEADWLTSLRNSYDGSALPQPEEYTLRETFLAKSLVSPHKLTAPALHSFFGYLSSPVARNAPTKWWVMLDLYGGAGSAISAFPSSWSSYAHRDALWTIQLYAYTDNHLPPFPDAAYPFMDVMLRSLTSAQNETAFGAYLNYIDPTIPPEKAYKLYYGDRLEKLREIKRRFDPEERFWHPQAINVGSRGV